MWPFDKPDSFLKSMYEVDQENGKLKPVTATEIYRMQQAAEQQYAAQNYASKRIATPGSDFLLHDVSVRKIDNGFLVTGYAANARHTNKVFQMFCPTAEDIGPALVAEIVSARIEE